MIEKFKLFSLKRSIKPKKQIDANIGIDIKKEILLGPVSTEF